MDDSNVQPAPFVFGSDNVFAAISWGEQRMELRISYQAVCLASKVWKRCLLHPRLPDLDKVEDLTVRESSGDGDEDNGLKHPSDVDNESQNGEFDGELHDEINEQVEVADIEEPSPPAEAFLQLSVDTLIEDKLEFLPAAKIGNSDGTSISRIHFSQSTKTEESRKVLDMQEDDAVAVLVLLSIAHLKFRAVPYSIGFDLLLEVARLRDYYDCVLLVEPWLARWLQNEEEESMKAGQAEWLFIAWVFGRDKIFSKLAASLVLDLEIDKDGCYVVKGEALSLELPLGILGI